MSSPPIKQKSFASLGRRKNTEIPPIMLDGGKNALLNIQVHSNLVTLCVERPFLTFPASRETTMNSNRASRRGALRLSRQASKNMSRGATDLSAMSVQTQATRGGKRKGVQSIKSLEEELKKAMPKGWNIREGFEVITSADE